MKTNGHELTDLEVKMIKIMDEQSGNDCYANFSDIDTDVAAWFGWFDKDFKDAALKQGIEGKMISGLAGSLVKKGIVSVYMSDYGEPNMKTGKQKQVKAFQIRASACEDARKQTSEVKTPPNPYAPGAPKKIKGKTLAEFVEFLEGTLIPDLKESGNIFTAQDFGTALKWIKHLQTNKA